jgi:hypothetical protein
MIYFLAVQLDLGLGAAISISAPFAVLTGLSVWLLPETKGARLVAIDT